MLTRSREKGNMKVGLYLLGGLIMRILPGGVILLVIGAALVGCFANSKQTTRSTSNKPSSPAKEAPNINGVDADGKRFALKDYRGKVVLLDFWASY